MIDVDNFKVFAYQEILNELTGITEVEKKLFHALNNGLNLKNEDVVHLLILASTHQSFGRRLKYSVFNEKWTKHSN